jgi:CubicO group peptidase (beta-lactamase class C family)
VPAGTRWFYNTPAYYVLFEVLEAATGQPRSEVAHAALLDRIGMVDTEFAPGGNTFRASARDMARFGLLYLNGGRWGDEPVIEDAAYLADSITTSQSLNHAYGYLFWLNGQDSYVLASQTDGVATPGTLIPDAPADMYAALGLGDKKIYVVPSLELVVVRHGEQTGLPQLATSSFDNVLWQKLTAVVAPAATAP